jgi:hypothetical protein
MRLRSDLGAGLANTSALGGFEEFREFKPSCRPKLPDLRCSRG